jgi:hypothetical protein
MGLLHNGTHYSNLTLLGGYYGGLQNFAGTSRDSISLARTFHNSRLSFPAGYYRASFLLPLKSGGIASSRFAQGLGAAWASIEAKGNLVETLQIELPASYANLAGGRNLAVNEVISVTVTADPIAKGRMAARVSIGAVPSADDVMYAILGRPIDGGYTLEQTLKILLSVAAGKTVIDTNMSTVTFRNLADDKNVIVADMDGSARETIVLNP